MLIVPTQPLPSQIIQITLNGQNCTINLYQKRAGMFLDLLVNNAPIIYGAICENLNLIVRSAYRGFVGDLIFIDNETSVPTQGVDPIYTGLGFRFSLAYLFPTDLPATLRVGVS